MRRYKGEELAEWVRVSLTKGGERPIATAHYAYYTSFLLTWLPFALFNRFLAAFSS